MHLEQPNQNPARSGVQRAARSIRSGLRRYPRAIIDSFKAPTPQQRQHLPTLIHDLLPHDLAAVWLGHATVLTQIGDHSVLIDPVLSDRIGMRLGSRTIGLPRLSPTPVTPSSLRGVDLILITHAHFDHLDRPTLAHLADTRTRVIVPSGCRSLVPPGFKDILELRPQEFKEIDGLEIRSIQPAHWGARRVTDRHRGVNAYVVEGMGQRVFFAGDSAHTDAFDHLDAIDLAVLGIGAYDPWEHMHATPEQAWSMFERIGARYLLPVHHSTFELSEEPIDEPMRRLRSIAGEAFESRVIDPISAEVIVIDQRTTDTKNPDAGK